MNIFPIHLCAIQIIYVYLHYFCSASLGVKISI